VTRGSRDSFKAAANPPTTLWELEGYSKRSG
jgi:hypothetical protein